MENEVIEELTTQAQDDLETIQGIVDRWTGYDEALKNLRLEIETLSDFLTAL